jgi:hypothetical protein
MGKSDGIRYSAHTMNYQMNVRCAGMSVQCFQNHMIDKCSGHAGNEGKTKLREVSI